MKKILLSAILILCCNILLGEDQIEKQLKEEIQLTTDPSKLHDLYKALGNRYTSIGKKEEAASAYARARQLELTRDLQAKLREIVKLSNDKKVDQAIKELRVVLAQNPDFLQARILLAIYLGWTGEYAEASSEIEKVLKVEPENSEAILTKANILRWEGKPAEAIPLYKTLLSQKENFQARLGLVWAYLNMQEYEEANREFQLLKPTESAHKADYEELASAIKRQPKPSQPEPQVVMLDKTGIQRALSLADAQKYDQALKEIDAVLEKDPKDQEAILAKANILRWSKHFQESIPLYFEILKNEENFNARLGLTWTYLHMGRSKDAELSFKLLMPTGEDQTKQQNELSAALKRAPEIATQTCEDIQKQLSMTQDPIEICKLYKKWGDCLAAQEREKEAVAIYQKALEPDCAVFSDDELLHMINYLGTHETIPPAIQYLEKMLSVAPQNLKARILYARFLSWDKKLKEAIAQSDLVLAEEPENTEALLIKANSLRWDQKYQESLPLYLMILEKGEDFDARLGLTWNYVYLEQFDKAEMSFALLEAKFPYQVKDKQDLAKGLANEKVEAPKRRIQKAIANAYKLAECRCFCSALDQLYYILDQNPCSIEVLLAISRVLSWAGFFCPSVQWARSVLRQDPRNVVALITAGNALRWKVHPGTYRMYIRALKIDPNDFYAKLGLAYALGSRTWVNSAYRIACSLNPKDRSEQIDYRDLLWQLPLRRSLNFRYYRYRDSDHLDTKRYSVIGIVYCQDCRFDFLLRYVDTTQPTIVPDHPILFEKSTTAQIDVFRSFSPNIDVGGGIGYANIRQDSKGDFLIGNLRSNIYTPCGNFSLGSVYDVFAETAAALLFKIRTWTNYITYINVLSGFTTVGAGYYYVKYSDANHSNKVNLWARRKFYDDGYLQLAARYEVTYWDFANQPFTIFAVPSLASGGHGYFDPKKYLANQLTFQAIYESRNKRFYGTLYPFVGYVTYHLLGLHYNGFYLGGGFIAGYRFNRCLLGEINAETTRYPLRHNTYTYRALSAWLRLGF